MTILLIIITVLVKVNSDQCKCFFLLSLFFVLQVIYVFSFFFLLTGQFQLFYVIMGIAIIMSLATNIFLSSLTGIISSFPPECMQSMLIGQSCSGILVAIFQAVSQSLQGDSQKKATYYFLISTFIMILAFVAYLFARKTVSQRHSFTATLVKVVKAR